MKPTDIQIGDLLTFEECLNDEAYPVIKVTGILQDSFFARIDDAKGEDELDYEGVVGIPLTAEILEKNGFRWDGSGQQEMMFMTPHNDKGIRYNLYVGLKHKTINVYSTFPELKSPNWRKHNQVDLEVCGPYVHELQHALRLCGIEKEIIV